MTCSGSVWRQGAVAECATIIGRSTALRGRPPKLREFVSSHQEITGATLLSAGYAIRTSPRLPLYSQKVGGGGAADLVKAATAFTETS